jgi:hypothetical protein
VVALDQRPSSATGTITVIERAPTLNADLRKGVVHSTRSIRLAKPVLFQLSYVPRPTSHAPRPVPSPTSPSPWRPSTI